MLAFRMAGIVRVSNRAKRRFRRELVESGLPDEIVEELVNYFNPSTPLREMLFRFSMR
ncbi:conserved protein of unknown function [Thermococcus camini]|uniref:Uncharacterized protein n=1 Tax=Thermococcus camini TaxID=2016373 RepID=A0A7G2D8G4_9EURY|nr:conserved protein of unknown function [Thermococcus camini]